MGEIIQWQRRMWDSLYYVVESTSSLRHTQKWQFIPWDKAYSVSAVCKFWRVYSILSYVKCAKYTLVTMYEHSVKLCHFTYKSDESFFLPKHLVTNCAILWIHTTEMFLFSLRQTDSLKQIRENFKKIQQSLFQWTSKT